MKSSQKGLLTDILTENADSVNTPSSTFSMYTQPVNFFLALHSPYLKHDLKSKSCALFAQTRFP